MKFRLLITCVLLSLLSCQDDSERTAGNTKAMKKQEAVFASVSRAWEFNTKPINPASQELMAEWAEWRIFMTELSQKPQSTIGAFRKKAKTLSLRVSVLRNRIPKKYDRPEIRARVGVLITKVNSLNLFINLPQIPDQKVSAIIRDINSEIISIQNQFDEVVRRSAIPKEIGEEDMIRMLDTSRAIPDEPKR